MEFQFKHGWRDETPVIFSIFVGGRLGSLTDASILNSTALKMRIFLLLHTFSKLGSTRHADKSVSFLREGAINRYR